jgi:hypothetical protein
MLSSIVRTAKLAAHTRSLSQAVVIAHLSAFGARSSNQRHTFIDFCTVILNAPSHSSRPTERSFFPYAYS